MQKSLTGGSQPYSQDGQFALDLVALGDIRPKLGEQAQHGVVGNASVQAIVTGNRGHNSSFCCVHEGQGKIKVPEQELYASPAGAGGWSSIAHWSNQYWSCFAEDSGALRDETKQPRRIQSCARTPKFEGLCRDGSGLRPISIMTPT